MSETLYFKAMNQAIYDEMARDERVVYLGEDVGIWGGCITKNPGLYTAFPDRVLDMPIAEAGFTGLAVGMAWGGLRPVVEWMYADFLSLGMDQLVNSASKMFFISQGETCTPMVVRTASGIGSQCGATHSQCVEGWVNNVPGIKIAVPTFPADGVGLLKYAIRNDDPVLFLENRSSIYNLKGDVPDGEHVLPFGSANVVREGSDVTIIAWHRLLLEAIKAADELAAEGISAEIVDPRTLIPLDVETIVRSVRKTGRAVVAHEAPKRGGMGGEIAAVIMEEAFDALKAPVYRIGNSGVVNPVGLVEFDVFPGKKDILMAVRQLAAG